MSGKTFDFRPSVELLQVLARGSLRQNLPKAVRLWVILRSLYGDKADPIRLQLGKNFTYSEWNKLFFTQIDKHHKDYKIPANHDAQCPCAKTISDWLFNPNTGVDSEEWQQAFLKLYPMSQQELNSLLATGIINKNGENSNKQKPLPGGRLFGITSKNIQYDFQVLAELGWVDLFKQYVNAPRKSKKQQNSKQRNTQKNDKQKKSQKSLAETKLKFLFKAGITLIQNLPHLELWEAKQLESFYLGLELLICYRKFSYIYGKTEKLPIIMLDKSNPETGNFINQADFAEIADNYFQPINNVPRFLMHVEYVVSPEANARISDLQDRLKQIWSQPLVPPIRILYDSASLGRVGKRIIYPVCIYYFQRAPYLCAFGQKPKNKNHVDWHNYRLDRIQEIEELSWDNQDVPALLKLKCFIKEPPSLEEIKTKMSEAWGFDFYQPSRKMLLRFDKNFHDSYIINTFRHDTFKFINAKADFTKFIQQYSPNQFEKEMLLRILGSLPDRPDDEDYPYAYYCADYRVDDTNLIDNNVMMRLRAWGPNVEVLLPGELRDRMAEHIQKTWLLYHS